MAPKIILKLPSSEVHEDSPAVKWVKSSFLLSRLHLEFSAEAERLYPRILSDSHVTDADHYITKGCQNLWDKKYRPRYEEECKRRGLPALA